MKNKLVYFIFILAIGKLPAMDIEHANASNDDNKNEVVHSKIQLSEQSRESLKASLSKISPTYSFNNPIVQEIKAACLKDDVASIKNLVSQRKINKDLSCFQKDWPLLHVAVQCNAPKIVAFLINEQEWDPFVLSANKKTLPESAAMCDSLEVFQFLNKVSKKNNNKIVNQAIVSDEQLLHLACKFGAKRVVRYLIEDKKVDPTLCNDSKIPIVSAAVGSDSIELLDYLVKQRGCDPLASKDNQTPLNKAVYYNALNAVKYLKELNQLNLSLVRLDANRTLLHGAAMYDALDVFIYLHEQCGLDLFAQDEHGEVPAFDAAYNNAVEVLRYIGITRNQKDALLKLRSKTDETLLHIAARRDSLEVFQLLVEWGADVFAVDEEGKSVIEFAAFYDAVGVMRYLSKRIDLRTFKVGALKGTLLHTCATGNALKTFRFLHSKGLDMHAKDDSGYTPLLDAVYKDSLAIVKLLIEEVGIPVNKKYSLKEDNQNISKLTVLHIAAITDAIDSWKYLRSKGADMYSQNCFGDTPLHEAAYNDSFEVMNDFISKNADYKYIKTICCNYRRNIMHAAAIAKTQKVLCLLVDKYFNLIYQIDCAGKVPLMYAKSIGKEDILYILRKLKDDNSIYHPKCVICDRQIISKANYEDFDIVDFHCMRVICKSCKLTTKFCARCVIEPVRM